MAEDKKKSTLFVKLFGKDRSNAVPSEAEEQASHDKLAEMSDEAADKSAENDYDAEYADWLTDAIAENPQDPDEDISEALAELFGENNTEESDEAPIFAIPGFEDISAAKDSGYDLYNTEDVAEEIAESSEISETSDEPEYTDGGDYGEFQSEEAGEAADLEYEEAFEDAQIEEENVEQAEEIVQDEEETAETAVDEDTATLLAALGYSDASAASAKKITRTKNTARNRPSDLSLAYGYDGKEYTSRSQTASVKSEYARDKFRMIIRLGATALFAILLCVYDIFGKSFGGVLDPTVYPVVNVMISLQLLLVAAAFSVKRLFAGVNAIFKGDLNVHSISALAVTVAVIYDVILAIAVPKTFTLYNFPASICLFLGAIHDYFVLEREICTFDRLSSWNSILTLERIDSAELASELGEGGVGEEGDTVGQAFRLRKGEFVENYFRHVNRHHPISKMLAFFVTPAVALAFVLFFVSLASDKSFAEAANAFVSVALFSLPAFMLVSMSFPFYTLVTKNMSSDSVILSEADVNEHRRLDTVVFEEADLFDETSLTINRISVCDKNQMQDVFDIMCGVSAMYNKIGGRIAGAFRASTSDGDTPAEVTVLRVEDGGFEGMAEGRHYCVGSDAYLTSKGVSVMRYYDDKYIASNPGGVVLHIAVDGTAVFKLYLTYSISPSNLSLINELSATKTRIIMRTIDPNVNLDLISRILSSSFDGNLTLIRKPYDGNSAEDNHKADGLVDGGVIVNGDSTEAILDTVRACRLFSAFSKLNFTAGIVVFAIGALFALFLGIIGAIVNLPSVYIFIFQIISVLPSVFFANIYLNK